MDKGTFVNVIIEIEKHSNVKWEYNRMTQTLELDRMLPYPYFYPYAYGFFPDTLGNDGDELDMLYITDTSFVNYNEIQASVGGYIVGGLIMEDEKGMDEKIFVVPENEIAKFQEIDYDTKHQIYEDIVWFFSHYKSKDGNKRWSKVHRIVDEWEATQIYKESLERMKRTI
jgi:inorganic pyrophosphatase